MERHYLNPTESMLVALALAERDKRHDEATTVFNQRLQPLLETHGNIVNIDQDDTGLFVEVSVPPKDEEIDRTEEE